MLIKRSHPAGVVWEVGLLQVEEVFTGISKLWLNLLSLSLHSHCEHTLHSAPRRSLCVNRQVYLLVLRLRRGGVRIQDTAALLHLPHACAHPSEPTQPPRPRVKTPKCKNLRRPSAILYSLNFYTALQNVFT